MTDTYLGHLSDYYNEKMKFQTKKKKFISCSKCPQSKQFKETNEELVFTCGSNKGKCGVQIKIKLPEYIHFPSYIRKLQETLDSHINWDDLSDYIETDKQMKEQVNQHKQIKDEIFKLSNEFYEENIKKNKESLQRFYTNRIEKTKRCRIIKKQLDTQELSSLEKQSLHKEYVVHVNDMKKEYEETKKLVEQLNPYLEKKQPKITIDNVQFKNESKPTKKPIKEVNPEVIQAIMDHFKEKEGILTKTDYNRLFRKQTKITWGKKLLPLLQQGDDDSWLSDKQDEIGSIIKVPQETNPSQIELTKEWISHLNIFDGASEDDLSGEDSSGEDESDADESGEDEPESQLEEQPEEPENPEPKVYTIKDIHEAYNKGIELRKQVKTKQEKEMINIKIQWKQKGSDEIENSYLDLDSKLDKRLKTKVKIYNNENQKMKIHISDIVKIELP